MENPTDSYFDDLLEDMEYAIKNEDGVLNITMNDLNKVKKLSLRNKNRSARLKRYSDVRELFERKFISYRDKLLSIYCETKDESLKQEIQSFLQDEQGDIIFGESSKL